VFLIQTYTGLSLSTLGTWNPTTLCTWNLTTFSSQGADVSGMRPASSLVTSTEADYLEWGEEEEDDDDD
jgi:hypothetical protein